MVLTITVVGSGGGTNGQITVGQDGHTILSPNDLAQLMSGQTVTGLLNPDGSITLNSNLMSAQQLGTTSNAATTTSGITVGIQQNGLSSATSPMASAISPAGSFQYSRNSKIESSNNVQSMNSSDLSNNNSASSVMMNHSSNNAQQQQSVLVEQQASPKKTGQKRLTAKQKQALMQQQQQHHQQQQQQQQSGMMQISDARQQLTTPNLDQTINVVPQQQPQVVATIQLPNGQIGQLIAPSGGSWMPNTLNLQQLSMAVAAATGTMPQTLSLPAGSNSISADRPQIQSPSNVPFSQQNQSQKTSVQLQQQNQTVSTTTTLSGTNSSNLSNQQQVIMTVQLPNSQLAQIIGRPSQVSQFWSGGPISYSTLTALAQQGIIQIVPLSSEGTQSGHGLIGDSSPPNQSMPTNQIGNVDQVSTQMGSAGRWTNDPAVSSSFTSQPSQQLPRSQQQSTSSSGTNARQRNAAPKINLSQQTNIPGDESLDGLSLGQSQKKLKRLACTCPNCRDGDHNRGGGDKKKQHICHFTDCNKVYGKTSHLRAHLRWHSGERPYACGWSFCGKKFTRSDELQRHRRTHTGEKRFECEQCRKKFMRSDHLSKHLRTHLASKKGAGIGSDQPVQLMSPNNMMLDQ